MASDPEVIDAVLRGEIGRYGELVERYQRPCWQLAYGLVGNLEDAKDLAQNGFVKAYRNLARFRSEAEFSTWLYRIIVNECKDFLRCKSRQPALLPLHSANSEDHDPILFDVADPAGDPCDFFQARELAQRISRAIRELPMKQKTAFLLHHLQGLTLGELAQAMGCRIGTVKSHLFRATEAIRLKVEPYIKTGAG